MPNINLEILKFQKTLKSLEDIYLKPATADRTNVDATIKRFEFTFELSWKTLKIFLNNQGLDVSFPRDVLKEAYKSNLINDEALWLSMLKTAI